MKAATCYSQNSFFKNCSPQQQLASSSYQRTHPLVKLLIKTCLQSEFNVQLCRNWITFPFSGSDVQLQWNPSLFLWSYKACNSFCCAPRRRSYINLWSEFDRETVSFDDIVHFIDENNVATYVDFDCGNTFYTETPTKMRKINRKRNHISKTCEKPKTIRSNDQHKCSIDEEQNYLVYLNPYSFWDMVPAALCNSTTLMMDPLCPISNLNQQLPT